MQPLRLDAARRIITAPSVVLFLALLVSQAGVLVLTPILVEVAREFDVSPAVAGQLRMITGLVAGAVALGFGRFGRGVALRDLLLAGAGLLAFGSLLSAAAPSFLVLAVAQVPIAVAAALLISAGGAAAGEWAPGRGRTVLSWSLIGPPAAWVVGMPIVGIVSEQSWRLGFLVLPFVASLVVAGALALCRKDVLPPARPLVRLADLLTDRTLRYWAVAELLAASAWVGTLVYSGALFIESYGLSPASTGLVLALAAVAYIPGNLLANRLLAGRAPLELLPVLVAASAGLVLLLGVVRVSVVGSTAILALLAFIVGARTMAAGALGLAVDPGRRLAVMGMRTAANQFGYFVGAAAGGVALALGSYPALGALYGALFTGALVALVGLARTSSRPAPG